MPRWVPHSSPSLFKDTPPSKQERKASPVEASQLVVLLHQLAAAQLNEQKLSQQYSKTQHHLKSLTLELECIKQENQLLLAEKQAIERTLNSMKDNVEQVIEPTMDIKKIEELLSPILLETKNGLKTLEAKLESRLKKTMESRDCQTDSPANAESFSIGIPDLSHIQKPVLETTFSEPLPDQSTVQQENARHEQLVQLLRATQKHSLDSPPKKERNVFFSNLIKTIQDQRASSDVIDYSSDSEIPNERPQTRDQQTSPIKIKKTAQAINIQQEPLREGIKYQQEPITEGIKIQKVQEPIMIKEHDSSLLFQEDTSMVMPVTQVIQSIESSKYPSVRSNTPVQSSQQKVSSLLSLEELNVIQSLNSCL